VPKTDAVRARARTGVKVDQAPSTETLSPKGVKTPTRTRGQTGGEALPTSGGRGRGAGQGLRLEGEPFPYPEYLVGMQAAIDSLWERPLVAGVLKTTVYFAILRSGQIDEALVEVGSGVRLFDRKALEAVVNASPLPPLPEGFKGAQLGVHLDFENEN
jgi:TonB family protein